MCFSAQASFASAAVITAAGVASLALVKERRELPFAALPLLFGIHQALEGLTWVELDGRQGAMLRGFGVHSWVVFAWALLPIYVPWSVRLIENDPRRRRWMAGLMAIGGVLAIVMLVQALQPEISVTVVSDQLDYRIALPFPAWYLGLPYVLATCVTPTISSHRWVQVFGVGNFLAMGAAVLIEARDYSSIWCTFAAFLSLIILAHYLHQRQVRSGARTPVVDPSPA